MCISHSLHIYFMDHRTWNCLTLDIEVSKLENYFINSKFLAIFYILTNTVAVRIMIAI